MQLGPGCLIAIQLFDLRFAAFLALYLFTNVPPRLRTSRCVLGLALPFPGGGTFVSGFIKLNLAVRTSSKSLQLLHVGYF